MDYQVHNTTKSLRILKKAMRSSDRVFYTRFGDGDIFLMNDRAGSEGTVGNNRTVWSQTISNDLKESLNIQDPRFMKAVSLDYEKEKGMEKGLFAPFGNKADLIKMLGQMLDTDDTHFFNPVLFHYLACFKPQKLKNFFAEFVKPKKKLFIGNCDKANMELMFGPIDYYVKVPEKNAYAKIDQWWPEVLKVIDKVDVVLPCTGNATRVIQGRLWKMGAKVHSLDVGSIVDAMDGQTTRTWLKMKGQEVRNAFDDSLKIDVVVPYRPDDLGAAYNEAMSKADDWVLFLDHDFMLLNPKWYDVCINAIRQTGHKAGWISAVTNRIGCPTQKVNLDQVTDSNNIEDHIGYSNNVWKQHGGKIHKATNSKAPFSGFFILTHKEAWRKAGGFGPGFLGVDNDYYNKLMLAGYDSYVLPGLYGYHLYDAKRLYKIGGASRFTKPGLKIVEKEKALPIPGTVSVIMMVKDEEKNLHRCFDSIKGLHDELIVVDTGSTDKTMEICKEYGAKLYEHPWKDFSTHRNQSMGYATGEWLFQIDADEEMNWQDTTPGAFKEWLFEQPNDVAGVEFDMDDFRGGRKAVTFDCRRCFRNGRGVYRKAAHNELIVSGEKVKYKDIRFNHYGYDLTPEEKDAKGERSIPLIKKRLKENPADYDCYFYLCEFYADLNQVDLSIENGEKYLKYKPFMGPRFNFTIYYSLINRYISVQNFDRARELIIEGLTDNPEDLDVNLARCQLGVMINDADTVINGARTFINTYAKYESGEIVKGNQFVFSFNPDTLAYAHYQLSSAYLQAGLHVMGKLKDVLPGATDQVKDRIEEDCKTRLGPIGLYDIAKAALSSEGERKVGLSLT